MKQYLPALIVALLLPLSHGAESPKVAEAAYQNFESGIPTVWKATGGAKFTDATERFKSGEHSLLWIWQAAGDSIEVSDAKLFDNKSAGKGFVFWAYNEKPAAAPMRAELLDQGKVVASLWFWMDFQGWRPLGASYLEVGLKPGQAVDAIRIHPTDGVAKGRLFLDCARFNLPIDSKSDRTGGEQMPWSGVPDGLRRKPAEIVISDTNIRLNRPWLPERKPVTEQQREDMKKLEERLLPSLAGPGKGLKAGTLDGLRNTMKDYRIHRYADGRITGRPVDSGSLLKPDDIIEFWEYLKFCTTVQQAHAQAKEPTERQELEQMFVNLSAHLIDQGWVLDSRLRGFQNYPGAAPTSFLAMREVLNKAGLSRGIALALASTLASQNDAEYLMKTPVSSMDGLGFWYNQLYPILLMLPDESERLQHMLVAKRFYDLALVNPDTIGPDGCTYHHGAAHFAYSSYNIPRLLDILLKTTDTGFRLDKATYERLKRYPRALAFTLAGTESPYNIHARAGVPSTDMNAGGVALQLAKLGTAYGDPAPDPEMMAIAARVYADGGPRGAAKMNAEPLKSWLAKGGKPAVLDGHLVLNGSPFDIHRRPGFLVAISGMTQLRRGLEIYGWTQQNNYARFVRNGSVSVVSTGSPPNHADSGWSLDGWNWCLFPGTTALLLPNAAMFEGYAIIGNASAFAGGTDLDGNGLFAMDRVDGGGVSFKKSVFCFDNRITVVTSDIKATGKSGAPVITTLFQNSIRPGHDSIALDDSSLLTLGTERQLDGSSDKVRWLIDNQAVGYHIPADQPALHLTCRKQEWTYWITKYLRDPKKDPFPPTAAAYQGWAKIRATADVNAIQAHYKPSVGEFALGWFDHGAKPAADAGCAYTMVIGTTPERMKHFAANPSYEILSRDSHVHALRDKPTGTTAYALFTANTDIAAAGPLRANNQPCHVMLRPDGAKLKLSLACTDTKRTQPVTITLDGDWKPTAQVPQVIRSISDGKITTLDLQPDSCLPLHLELVPVKGL